MLLCKVGGLKLAKTNTRESYNTKNKDLNLHSRNLWFIRFELRLVDECYYTNIGDCFWRNSVYLVQGRSLPLDFKIQYTVYQYTCNLLNKYRRNLNIVKKSFFFYTSLTPVYTNAIIKTRSKFDRTVFLQTCFWKFRAAQILKARPNVSKVRSIWIFYFRRQKKCITPETKV